jgi:hypothetical protein
MNNIQISLSSTKTSNEMQQVLGKNEKFYQNLPVLLYHNILLS